MTAPPREPQSIYDALSTIYDWLCDDRLTQWPYMENGPFYFDLPKYQEVARVALAAAPAPSALICAECDQPLVASECVCTRCASEWHLTAIEPPAPSAEPPAQAATDDLVRKLRKVDVYEANVTLRLLAAERIEQQAREIAELTRAEREANERAHSETERRLHAEALAALRLEWYGKACAERDVLRECVRAADAMRDRLYKPRGDTPSIEAYDAARAKVRYD